MKAFVRDEYGSPDVLELRDIDKPEIADARLEKEQRSNITAQRSREVPVHQEGPAPAGLSLAIPSNRQSVRPSPK
jgi:hypothetical protein